MKPVILLKDKTDEYDELFTSHGYNPFFIPVLSPIEFMNKDKLEQVVSFYFLRFVFYYVKLCSMFSLQHFN